MISGPLHLYSPFINCKQPNTSQFDNKNKGQSPARRNYIKDKNYSQQMILFTQLPLVFAFSAPWPSRGLLGCGSVCPSHNSCSFAGSTGNCRIPRQMAWDSHWAGNNHSARPLVVQSFLADTDTTNWAQPQSRNHSIWTQKARTRGGEVAVVVGDVQRDNTIRQSIRWCRWLVGDRLAEEKTKKKSHLLKIKQELLSRLWLKKKNKQRSDCRLLGLKN